MSHWRFFCAVGLAFLAVASVRAASWGRTEEPAAVLVNLADDRATQHGYDSGKRFAVSGLRLWGRGLLQ